MAELERQLSALARELDWPETPELASRVRAGLGARPQRSRRPLVVALAVVLAAVAVALAVPPARSAILRFLHLQGVTVVRVDTLPPAAPMGGPGEPMPLARAQARAHLRTLLPDAQRPDGTYLDTSIPGDAVVLRYGSLAHPRLYVTEYRTGNFDVVKKYTLANRSLQTVTVDGQPGIWIGGKHVVEMGPTPPRIAGPTLIWLHGPLTLRIEGRFTLADALRIARSFR
jgi:hypothetical protein